MQGKERASDRCLVVPLAEPDHVGYISGRPGDLAGHDLRATQAADGGPERITVILWGQAGIGFFFTTARWQGEPVNREPHKCAGLCWVDPACPPTNTVPYNAAALAAITREAAFSLDGW